jgi:hypothetical protein
MTALQDHRTLRSLTTARITNYKQLIMMLLSMIVVKMVTKWLDNLQRPRSGIETQQHVLFALSPLQRSSSQRRILVTIHSVLSAFTDGQKTKIFAQLIVGSSTRCLFDTTVAGK